MILLIALIEAFELFRRAYAAENLSWESVFSGPTGAVVLGIFLAVFAVRFVMFFWSASNLVVRSLTWWLAVGADWYATEFYGPEPGMVYDLFGSFPLQVSGFFFVLFGGLRFLYFTSLSFKDDFNTNR